MEEENNNKVYSKVPVKTGFWQKFKNFWLQPITLELTPMEKKVFGEVHDFWNQEIVFENGGLHLKMPEHRSYQADTIQEEMSQDNIAQDNIFQSNIHQQF